MTSCENSGSEQEDEHTGPLQIGDARYPSEQGAVGEALIVREDVGVAPNHRQALHAGQDVLLPFAGHEAQSL
jgi:hypothetical protein